MLGLKWEIEKVDFSHLKFKLSHKYRTGGGLFH